MIKKILAICSAAATLALITMLPAVAWFGRGFGFGGFGRFGGFGGFPFFGFGGFPFSFSSSFSSSLMFNSMFSSMFSGFGFNPFFF